ncbi:MAG: hypothetical protein KC475_08955 [Cyanobacteria bacterium HKST-UBA03]|nr:hypothetical protein [Cyanobacteria bacterium HKST-UBA03]
MKISLLQHRPQYSSPQNRPLAVPAFGLKRAQRSEQPSKTAQAACAATGADVCCCGNTAHNTAQNAVQLKPRKGEQGEAEPHTQEAAVTVDVDELDELLDGFDEEPSHQQTASTGSATTLDVLPLCGGCGSCGDCHPPQAEQQAVSKTSDLHSPQPQSTPRPTWRRSSSSSSSSGSYTHSSATRLRPKTHAKTHARQKRQPTKQPLTTAAAEPAANPSPAQPAHACAHCPSPVPVSAISSSSSSSPAPPTAAVRTGTDQTVAKNTTPPPSKPLSALGKVTLWINGFVQGLWHDIAHLLRMLWPEHSPTGKQKK